MNKSAAKITTDDIRGYIGYLAENRHLAETSLQTHINTLRAFFGWLHIEEKIKKNPMSKIKSLKLDKKGARQALTVEELERLRDACQGYREKAPACLCPANRHTSRSNLGQFSVLSARSARGQDWKSMSTRICCAIPLRRTRSTAAWTSLLFRNCWGMRTYRRRRSMRRCRTKQ